MVVILLLLTAAALINRQQREGLKTWMQEAYAPPVQLDKSESNWGSKKKKNKTWNRTLYYILELELNDFGKKYIIAIILTESPVSI